MADPGTVPVTTAIGVISKETGPGEVAVPPEQDQKPSLEALIKRAASIRSFEDLVDAVADGLCLG